MKANLIKFITLITLTLFFLNSCGLYKRSDIKDNPVNVDERVKRNIQEGKVHDHLPVWEPPGHC